MNNPMLIRLIFKLFHSTTKMNIAYFNINNLSLQRYLPCNVDKISTIDDYFNSSINFDRDIPDDLLLNNLDHYIVYRCGNEHLYGVFICGPFLTKPFNNLKVKDIKLDVDDKRELLNYYSTMPLVHPSEQINIRFLITSLSRLTPKDLANHPHAEFNNQTIKTTSLPDDYVVNGWQNDIMIENIADIGNFYHALFTSQTDQEIKDALGTYFYITQPLEFLCSSVDFEEMRTHKNLMYSIIGITLAYALRYGLDQHTALNLSLYYSYEAESKNTISDLADLRNSMFIEYSRAIKKLSKPNYSKVVNDIIGIINNNIRHKLTVGAIADRMDYNAAYLSDLFKKETGVTIKDYILNSKINLAKNILLDTPLSIADISDFLGFKTYSHFSSTFKRLTGFSPSYFRTK